MADDPLDDVDRQILSLMQDNARYTAIELADHVGVSDNTIHNRMERLEEQGVITGYTATVDHKAAGLDLYFEFVCTVRVSDQAAVAAEALELAQVIEVSELMTGQRNLHIKAVGAEDEDITQIAQELDELDLEINEEILLRAEHSADVDYQELQRVLEAPTTAAD